MRCINVKITYVNLAMYKKNSHYPLFKCEKKGITAHKGGGSKVGNRLVVRIKEKAMVSSAVMLMTMAFLFFSAGQSAHAEELSFCDIALTKITINPDGTTEYESDRPEIGGKTKEEVEREERRRQEEEYWRDRQPTIQERRDDSEEIEKRKPIPGRDFPVLPTKPEPVKKMPPKPFLN